MRNVIINSIARSLEKVSEKIRALKKMNVYYVCYGVRSEKMMLIRAVNSQEAFEHLKKHKDFDEVVVNVGKDDNPADLLTVLSEGEGIIGNIY